MNKLITKYFYFILLSGSSLLYSQNYSLSFDGNDQYVNLGYSANFDLNDATISIWFKSDWNTYYPDWTGLFGRHDNWAFAMQYNYDTQNTRLSFQTSPSSGVSDNVFTPDEIPINDGLWHHALVTRNASSGTFRLYFDGVFIMDNEDVNNNWEAPSSVLAGTVTSNHPLLIGKHHPAHNRTASGFVDDIAIWDKELNDAQIQQLFNQESPTSIDYSNLTGYWNFESGSGSTVYDQTSYQNNGEIINSASWSDDVPSLPQQSSLNYSLSFDGVDDYVMITDDESLTSTSVMTISAWFKKVSGPGWMSLVGKGTSDANEEYILMLKDDQVYFDVGQGGGPYIQQSATIDSETWHHIAAVHTRSNGTSMLKVYLNGEDVGGTTIGATSTPNDNSYPLTIGSRFFTPNALFNGQIDDVRIWSDALDGQQIQEIMYNNLSDYEDDLIGYWNFN